MTKTKLKKLKFENKKDHTNREERKIERERESEREIVIKLIITGCIHNSYYLYS